jgi:response regulator of citrate/malate metabolism
MNLLIDSKRFQYNDIQIDVIARTYESAKILLSDHNWDCILIDYYLGYQKEICNGYEILKDGCIFDLLPDKVILTAVNPVEFYEMKILLYAYGYKDGPTNSNAFIKLPGTYSPNDL